MPGSKLSAIENGGEHPALLVDGLSFSYGGSPVLEGVSFALDSGELAFLTGENGSGKSTLLRCLAGWSEPQEGRIFLDNMLFNTADRTMRSKVAFVSDSPTFYDDMTAEEHLAFIRQVNRIAESRYSEELMKKMGLAECASRLPSTYSRGMRMKLALVLAFVVKPRLLLLDEPFGPLDPQAALALSGLLSDVLREGASVVVSCHHEVPRIMPDKTLSLCSGKLSIASA